MCAARVQQQQQPKRTGYGFGSSYAAPDASSKGNGRNAGRVSPQHASLPRAVESKDRDRPYGSSTDLSRNGNLSPRSSGNIKAMGPAHAPISAVAFVDTLGPNEVPCQECLNSEAASHLCLDCDMYLCAVHSQAHAKTRSTASHTLRAWGAVSSNAAAAVNGKVSPRPTAGASYATTNIGLASPRSGSGHSRSDSSSFSGSIPPTVGIGPCPKHQLETRYYCVTCGTSICQDCRMVSHFDHSVKTIRDAWIEQSHMLEQVRQYCASRVTGLQGCITSIAAVRRSIGEKRQLQLDHAKAFFDRLRRTIAAREQEVTDMLQQEAAERLGRLDKQQGETQSELVALEPLYRSLDNALATQDQQRAQEVKLSLDKLLMKTKGRPADEFQPVAAADFEFDEGNCAPLEQLISQVGRMGNASCSAALCTITGEGLRKARAGEFATFTIQACDASGRPMQRGGDHFSVTVVRHDTSGAAGGIPISLTSPHGPGGVREPAGFILSPRGNVLASALRPSQSAPAMGVTFAADDVGHFSPSATPSGLSPRGSPRKGDQQPFTGSHRPGSAGGKGGHASTLDGPLSPRIRRDLQPEPQSVSGSGRSSPRKQQAGTMQSALTVEALGGFGRGANGRDGTASELTFGSGGGSLASAANQAVVEVVDNNDGTYTVRYRPHVAGLHLIRVTLRQVAVQGSPFVVHVSPRGQFLTGKLSRRFGTMGAEPSQLQYPSGVAFDSSCELVFVTDQENHRVQVFRRDGLLFRRWGSKGSAPGQFNRPAGVCVDISADNTVYVTDRDNHRVQVFRKDGTFITQFGGQGSGAGNLRNPEGIAIDGDELFVCDYVNARICVFDRKGRFLRQFGSDGSGPGQLSGPMGIAVDGQHHVVFVADCLNHRVQLFDRSGRFIKAWGTKGSREGELKYPFGIAVDPSQGGCVYVADGENHRIQTFRPDGRFISVWGGPGGSAGQLMYPRYIALDADFSRLAVADSNNHRVQIFK